MTYRVMRGRSYKNLQRAFLILVLPVLPLAMKLTVGASPLAVDRTSPAKTLEFRTELLMGLDLFVRAERALWSDSASFSRSLGHTPDVFGALTHYYRIEVEKASRQELLVLALAENRKSASDEVAALIGDRVVIDEKFVVRANFPMPQAPRDYLHTLAQSVMNHISLNSMRIPNRAELDLLEGVFRRNFRYEVRTLSQGGKTLVALGLEAPVAGDVVEMKSDANLYSWVYEHRAHSFTERELRGHLEDIYLTQRIFQEHTGSYATTFKELVPALNRLSALDSESALYSVQEFQPDPTFGFQAEVGLKQLGREPSSNSKALAVNGYGQFSEVSSIEGIVSQFEKNRRKMSGENSAVLMNSPEGVSDSADRHNPLLIDPVIDSDTTLGK
jgi:hypothetical protein